MWWFCKRQNGLSHLASQIQESSDSTASPDLTEKHPTKSSHNSELSSSSDGKIILTKADCEDKLGFAYSEKKKWLVITVIFLVQTSMNFNAAVYGNAVHPMMEKFGVSAQMGRIGQMAFLIAYAFGCELWAPWSEELGRFKVLQWSLGLVNLWQIPCALLSMYGHGKGAVTGIIIFRTLGGLSSAGGSVTLGMVADMWRDENLPYPIAFVVFSSVGGSIFGPLIGGFLQTYLPLAWNFWFQLMIGAVVQAVHFFFVPETRSSCIITEEAKKRREAGEPNVFSEAEMNRRSFMSKEGLKHCTQIWLRPFKMFLTEPIVLFLSLISGFSDALIFTFLHSLSLVYAQWHFNAWQTGLIFLSIGLGYIVSYAIWLLVIWKTQKIIKAKKSRDPNYKPSIESKLTWLLWTAPLLVIGIFGFAPTSTGPTIPWIAPTLFLLLIGIANLAIYGATIDYMILAYGEKYSASACGGNGFARDFLAGVAAMYAHPLYTQMPGTSPAIKLRNASLLLGAIGAVLIIPIYVFKWFGPWVRSRSRFAKEVAADKEREESTLPLTAKEGSSGVEAGQGVLQQRTLRSDEVDL